MTKASIEPNAQPIEEGGILVWRTHDIEAARTLAAVVADANHHRENNYSDEPDGQPHRLHEECVSEGYDPVTQVPDRWEIGWYRKIPCPPNSCGQHKWHMHDGVEGERGVMPAVYFHW